MTSARGRSRTAPADHAPPHRENSPIRITTNRPAPSNADAASLRLAGRLTVGDFEDAMQVAAAIACGAEVIATRNLRDFRESPVPALTPADLVRSFDGHT